MGLSSTELQAHRRWLLGQRRTRVVQPSPYERDRLTANLVRAARNMVSLNDVKDAEHGTALLRVMSGHIDSLLQKGTVDTILQACAIVDDIPRIRGLLNSLEQWAIMVSNLGPDGETPESVD